MCNWLVEIFMEFIPKGKRDIGLQETFWINKTELLNLSLIEKYSVTTSELKAFVK